MTEITFMASSKPFILPDEIEEYNNRRVFEREEDFIQLWVDDIGVWKDDLEGLFTMPYIYEIGGAGNRLFLLYLEKHMETGDVLELFHIPNQHRFEHYKRRLLENPEPITINIGSLTYEDKNGTYQFNQKDWVNELSRKNFLTAFGVTTIVKF